MCSLDLFYKYAMKKKHILFIVLETVYATPKLAN